MRRSLIRSVVQSVARVVLLMAMCGGSVSGGTAFAQAPPAADGSAELAGLFADYLHYARLGKFTEAGAYGEKILQLPDLDPVAVLKLADKDKNAVPTLITLIQHTSIAASAQGILDVIREGEFRQRQDSARILDNLERLGGAPQMEFNAIQRLKESGEYAIPQMIAALTDPAKSKLWPRLIRALPQIGRPAVSPLVVALGTESPDLQRNIVWALGEIGYPQAVPYLLKLLARPDLSEEARQAAYEALSRIQSVSEPGRMDSAPAAFVALADQYYREHGSVKADPRLSTANVWYWKNEELTAIQVPTDIYGAVMAMRACEEALLLEPNNRDALALWLAADFRREARLGMNVESGEADAGADADATRPANLPRSIYFARAAGPEYCHLVLGRAVRDVDKQVALGAIAALDVVAGASSLVGGEDYKQPLVQALRFPDAEVRIKAAIALSRALPKTAFSGAETVGYVLAEALAQGGKPQYVVACADAENLNRLASELRDLGATVVAEANFYAAMDRARRELPAVTGFVLATDIEAPPVSAAMAELRREFRFARTPAVVLVKPGEEHRAEFAVTGAPTATTTDYHAGGEQIRKLIEDSATKGGSQPLDKEIATELALRAADALQLVAVDGRTVIDPTPAIGALIVALDSDEQALQVRAAQVLALLPSAAGQQATADVALNANNDTVLRIAAFDALAESAKRQGNRLGDGAVAAVIKVAREAEDLALRTAASQALGALNLQRGEASEIVRSYYRG